MSATQQLKEYFYPVSQPVTASSNGRVRSFMLDVQSAYTVLALAEGKNPTRGGNIRQINRMIESFVPGDYQQLIKLLDHNLSKEGAYHKSYFGPPRIRLFRLAVLYAMYQVGIEINHGFSAGVPNELRSGLVALSLLEQFKSRGLTSSKLQALLRRHQLPPPSHGTTGWEYVAAGIISAKGLSLEKGAVMLAQALGREHISTGRGIRQSVDLADKQYFLRKSEFEVSMTSTGVPSASAALHSLFTRMGFGYGGSAGVGAPAMPVSASGVGASQGPAKTPLLVDPFRSVPTPVNRSVVDGVPVPAVAPPSQPAPVDSRFLMYSGHQPSALVLLGAPSEAVAERAPFEEGHLDSETASTGEVGREGSTAFFNLLPPAPTHDPVPVRAHQGVELLSDSSDGALSPVAG